MRLRSPASRTAAAAVTVLQLLGAALGPIVDARVEAAEQVATAHIESERSAPCTPGHNEFFCQICRTISVAGAFSARTLAFSAGTVRSFVEDARSDVPPRQTLHSPHAPRAPPLS